MVAVRKGKRMLTGYAGPEFNKLAAMKEIQMFWRELWDGCAWPEWIWMSLTYLAKPVQTQAGTWRLRGVVLQNLAIRSDRARHNVWTNNVEAYCRNGTVACLRLETVRLRLLGATSTGERLWISTHTHLQTRFREHRWCSLRTSCMLCDIGHITVLSHLKVDKWISGYAGALRNGSSPTTFNFTLPTRNTALGSATAARHHSSIRCRRLCLFIEPK
jgi:hypothetical protein